VPDFSLHKGAMAGIKTSVMNTATAACTPQKNHGCRQCLVLQKSTVEAFTRFISRLLSSMDEARPVTMLMRVNQSSLMSPVSTLDSNTTIGIHGQQHQTQGCSTRQVAESERLKDEDSEFSNRRRRRACRASKSTLATTAENVAEMKSRMTMASIVPYQSLCVKYKSKMFTRVKAHTTCMAKLAKSY